MEQARATELLKGLIQRGQGLDPFDDMRRERFVLDSRAVLERIFGAESRQRKEFADIYWSASVISQNPDKNRENDVIAKERAKRRAVTLLESILHEVEQFWDDDQAEPSVDPLTPIARICERFHSVARQLRHRHDKRATLDVGDEYDVQDLMHALLLLDFDDVRPEEWAPSYAGASSRMDFLLKSEKIVLEAKRSRKGLGAKQIGEELLVDCQRYQTHPDCKRLICFVYDPEGFVANARGLEKDLASAGGEMPVTVFIRPTQ